MRVRRGRRETVDADRAATRDLVERTATDGEPGLRVWYPPRQVSFGRRDRAAEGYDSARTAARERGFPPAERETGGRPVAFTGDVLAVVRAEPVDASEPRIESRYETALGSIRSALAATGVEATRGEPPNSFCPGSHSLQADGKVVGLAQRVQRDVAVVAGALVVRDPGAVAAVIEPVSDALGIEFDPATVGSVATAGGTPEQVRDEVEAALVDGDDPTVRET